MAFTTFVYDTLDVCTRLGRYILQELTGWHGRWGRFLRPAADRRSAAVFSARRHPSNAPMSGVEIFWNLFGASNQLLAALTLLGVTVWLWRTHKAWWVWVVTGIPTVFMYVMSTWALISMSLPEFLTSSGALRAPADPVPWIGLVLTVLAALMLIEAIRILSSLGRPSGPKQEVLPAAAGVTA